MSRKRHPTIRTGELPLPVVDEKQVERDRQALGGFNNDYGPGVAAQSSQLDRANALAHAREEGAREATIATMAECAAIAYFGVDIDEGNGRTSNTSSPVIANNIVTELRRRFPNDPRVLYHLQMRGLG